VRWGFGAQYLEREGRSFSGGCKRLEQAAAGSGLDSSHMGMVEWEQMPEHGGGLSGCFEDTESTKAQNQSCSTGEE
jgi:hypothetical protein